MAAVLVLLLAALLAGLGQAPSRAAGLVAPGADAAPGPISGTNKPTLVLVHGAFADSSG